MQIISSILCYGLVGGAIFLALLFFLAHVGLTAFVRDEEGHFRKALTWQSLLAFAIFFCLLFAWLYIGNQALPTTSNLGTHWMNAFGIFLVLHLFDLIVIDYLIVVRWHPSFLRLPDTDYYRRMQPHIRGFWRGIPFGAGFSFLVSLVSVA